MTPLPSGRRTPAPQPRGRRPRHAHPAARVRASPRVILGVCVPGGRHRRGPGPSSNTKRTSPIETKTVYEPASAPTPSPGDPAGQPEALGGHGHDDELLDTPRLRRGLSANLERMENILRNPAQLAKAGRRDPTLGPIRAMLEVGQGDGTSYAPADDNLLWHAPRGWSYAIVVPHQLVPGVLALIHRTNGHTGTARTTLLIERKFHWSTLKSDVRGNVLSCPCRRRKRAWSKQLSMMPARLLQPCEGLQMDIQDMKVKSDKGNQYLLVVVDRGSKFLAAFPLPARDALSVSRKLLGLLLTFGVMFSIRADMESENIARVMQHLCNWLKISLDYGPVNHPREQVAVQRMGGWLQEVLSLLRRSWPKRWDDYVPAAAWIHRVTPDPSLPGGASPYQILFGRPPRSHIDFLAQPLDGAAFGQGLKRTVEAQHHLTQEILAKRQEILTKQRERLVLHGAAQRAAHSPAPCRGRRCQAVPRTTGEPPTPLRRRVQPPHLVRRLGPGRQLRCCRMYPRRVGKGKGGSGTWGWEYRGRYHDGAQSDWITEDEARDRFSPLQLDILPRR